MQKPDITRLIEFQKLLLLFNNLERQVYHSGRAETDTEHSYSLAMAGWFLSQYFPGLDNDLVIRLALIHDLVEIHAGDTFAYAAEAELSSKAEREAAAVKRLAEEWNDFPEMHVAIAMYESRDLPEAKFVYALDKMMPAFLNYLNQGDVWRMHNITLEKFMAEKESKVPVSPEVYEYYQQFLTIIQDHMDWFSQADSTTQLKG